MNEPDPVIDLNNTQWRDSPPISDRDLDLRRNFHKRSISVDTTQQITSTPSLAATLVTTLALMTLQPLLWQRLRCGHDSDNDLKISRL
jgi:hypothetical protein